MAQTYSSYSYGGLGMAQTYSFYNCGGLGMAQTYSPYSYRGLGMAHTYSSRVATVYTTTLAVLAILGRSRGCIRLCHMVATMDLD